MKCIKCGNEVPDTDKNCAACGNLMEREVITPVAVPASKEKVTEDKKFEGTGWRTAIIIIGYIILIAIMPQMLLANPMIYQNSQLASIIYGIVMLISMVLPLASIPAFFIMRKNGFKNRGPWPAAIFLAIKIYVFFLLFSFISLSIAMGMCLVSFAS